MHVHGSTDRRRFICNGPATGCMSLLLQVPGCSNGRCVRDANPAPAQHKLPSQQFAWLYANVAVVVWETHGSPPPMEMRNRFNKFVILSNETSSKKHSFDFCEIYVCVLFKANLNYNIFRKFALPFITERRVIKITKAGSVVKRRR